MLTLFDRAILRLMDEQLFTNEPQMAIRMAQVMASFADERLKEQFDQIREKLPADLWQAYAEKLLKGDT